MPGSDHSASYHISYTYKEIPHTSLGCTVATAGIRGASVATAGANGATVATAGVTCPVGRKGHPVILENRDQHIKLYVYF